MSHIESNAPIQLDERQTKSIEHLLDEINPSRPGSFEPRAINWANLPAAVLSCTKAGVDILGLAESGGLDVTRLPTLTIDGVACYQALKSLKS